MYVATFGCNVQNPSTNRYCLQLRFATGRDGAACTNFESLYSPDMVGCCSWISDVQVVLVLVATC